MVWNLTYILPTPGRYDAVKSPTRPGLDVTSPDFHLEKDQDIIFRNKPPSAQPSVEVTKTYPHLLSISCSKDPPNSDPAAAKKTQSIHT